MNEVLLAVAALALLFSAVPAVQFLRNLLLYLPPPGPTPEGGGPLPAVSVLIPARNEEKSIGPALESVLLTKGIDFEVVVLDDHSEDRTAEVVSALLNKDPRLRLEQAPDLPPGWCGKQHACWVLAQRARHSLLLFLDADVRLAPDGVARLVRFLQVSRADLVSGIPHQETGTFMEKLLIPLIHFVLLGFLPLRTMRQSRSPSYAAGCGQLFLARREGYEIAGGHSAVRETLHDGIKLPRAFRSAGLLTDLCDATDIATCRMYRGAAEVWRGLAKNATEGLAAPRLIVPATLLLSGGQVLPWVLLITGSAIGLPPLAWVFGLLAAGLGLLPRLISAWRFRQSWLGAVLHPLGVVVLLAIQWYSLSQAALGRPATWKGRAYSGATGLREAP